MKVGIIVSEGDVQHYHQNLLDVDPDSGAWEELDNEIWELLTEALVTGLEQEGVGYKRDYELHSVD